MIRIGSIGLGGISKGVHIPGIQASEDLQLIALCDVDEARLKERAAEYGIAPDHCFTDYRDLIDCPDVDAVDVSTPNCCHAEIAEYAARAGKPYDLEKPITLDKTEAKALYDATMASGVKSMICFSYRYKASARYARSLVRSGKLGRIYHVNMQYYQSWGLERADTPLVWRYEKSKAGSGALGDLGCHALDLCEFVTGEKYDKVFAHLGTFIRERRLLTGEGMGRVDVDDYSNLLLETASGASLSFEISRFNFGRGNYQRMEIYGEKGAIVYSLDRIPGVDEIELCDETTDGKFIPLEIPEEYKVSQMQSFADIVLDKADGLSATIEDGLRSQILLDSILESAEKGTWVKL